jgi:arylsulfatase A-like enzyme
VRPALRLLVPLLLAVNAGCRSTPSEVAVDLTNVRVGVMNERARLLRVEGEPTARAVASDRPGMLEITLRLPSDAELRYRTVGTTLVRPMAVNDDGRNVPLALRKDPDGSWRSVIPNGSNEPQTLRLLTTASRGPMWVEPHIVGRTTPTPPVLSPEQRPTVQRPNIILYVVDTLRADRLSLYGYRHRTTPQLERLAQHALVFDNAYAAGSFTSPSITALFSSRFPSEVRGRLAVDGPAQQTLAEVLRTAGYQTAGFQANLLCMPELGYGRGFDRYERLGHVEGETRAKVTVANATALHATAMDWVRRRDPDRPFFLYLQSMDVHFPYQPPAPFRDLYVASAPAKPTPEIVEQLKHIVPDGDYDVVFETLNALSPERYDGAVAYVDHSLGALFATLERMGLMDDTIVVVTADHGEPLMDRGEMFHGRSIYEELVRVPLIVWLPGVRDGARVPTIVSHLQVAPTLVELAGVTPPAQFLGRSWFAPGTPFEPPAAMGELMHALTHEANGWFVREGPWKLIAERDGEELTYRLFHLPTDPGETRDVAAENSRMARYLLARATARPYDPAPSPTAPLDAGLSEAARAERQKALQALGYVE